MPRSRRKIRIVTVSLTSNLSASDMPFGAETALDTVPNPYDPGTTTTVTRSLRSDPLAALRARGVIDQAQFAAGRKWQGTYEACTVGAIQALDPLRPAVDGGARSGDFSLLQLQAFEVLHDSRLLLGEVGFAIAREILGEGLRIEEVAQRRGHHSEAAAKYYGRRFREALESLAVHWGFASRSPHRPP